MSTDSGARPGVRRPPGAPPPDVLRLAELLAALSFATDAANAAPAGTAVRTALAAVRLAEAAALPPADVRTAFWSALLLFLGCTAFAPEEASIAAGHDNGYRAAMGMVDGADRLGVVRAIARASAPAGRWRQLGALARHVAWPEADALYAAAQCEVAARLASQLGMSADVVSALWQKEERWDGHGAPAGLRGDAGSRAMRVVRIAHAAHQWHRFAGDAAACAMLRERAGGQLDPSLARLARAEWPRLSAAFTSREAWSQLLEAEPTPVRVVAPAALTGIATAFAHFVDLKSVWTRGHSSSVAQVAASAAGELGLDPATMEAVMHASLLHDLGRVAIPNAVWDTPGPLDAPEWELVRLHPYLSARTLRQTTALARLAPLAARHHERLDGSGYPAGLPGSALTVSERLLAVCDAWRGMQEARAHRAPLTHAAAVRRLAAESRAGRLCRECVAAVLAASGTPRPPALHQTGDLTPREVDVLRLVATGRTNKEIATTLGISARTVGHHLAHCYARLGVSTRAGAALVAMERGLLAEAGEHRLPRPTTLSSPR